MLSEASDTKHLDRFLSNDRVHSLCRVQTNSIRNRETTCWHNTQPSVFRNSKILWIVLVFNGGGLAQVQHDQLQSFRQALLAAGADLLDWNEDLPDPTAPAAAPKLSARFQNATTILQLAPQHWRETPADPPSDADLAVRYESLPRRTPDARFRDPAYDYTDGSEQGTSLTGAVYQESSNRRESFALSGHDSQLHTALRAELAGVYCGVRTAPSDDCRLPRYILTDSQTSIFLISKAIHRPEALRTHKHKHLLHRIAQTLLAQDTPVHILKVRAHTGVRGNEIVDGLATDAHENPTTGPFCTAGRAGRGLHWVTYMYASPTDPTEAPTIRDTDDLHRHLITIAGKAQTKAALSDPEQSLLRKVNSMLNEHGGIDVQISAAVWTTTLLNPWQQKLVALVRTQQLYTAYRRVQFTKLTGDAARQAAICQQCGKDVDDAHHALNMCTAPQADREIKLRHDNAVCKIAAAALKGRHAQKSFSGMREARVERSVNQVHRRSQHGSCRTIRSTLFQICSRSTCPQAPMARHA